METQKSQPAKQQSSAALDPAITSCRRKKKDDATFLEDLKDHIDEFIHASMDEHKDCFTKTIKKVSSHLHVQCLIDNCQLTMCYSFYSVIGECVHWLLT
ncbi:hypothetical protein NC651_011332 [Populus alba x Populus x berolinensis]|nr:hypothetical protein NC651_011332 [Populus alba x Populus x berolinensis]